MTNDFDIDPIAAGERRGSSAGFCPSHVIDRFAMKASRGGLRVSLDGMPLHDRPIGPETMR